MRPEVRYEGWGSPSARGCDELERLYAAEMAEIRRDAACPCYDEERVLSRMAKRLPRRVLLWPNAGGGGR